MKRAAVFVDAGYLFAQGSVAITGTKASRSRIRLDAAKARDCLLRILAAAAPDRELLRIYWYDGIQPGRSLTADHEAVADLNDVKLRLGFINSAGQQKGVDSLIVTDLVELARNGAIGDALLLSGDEDVRIGVTIAQSFGVRVHLVGIAPARSSQAKTLLQEVDTRHEMSAGNVRSFLAVQEEPDTISMASQPPIDSSFLFGAHPTAVADPAEPDLRAHCTAVIAEIFETTAPSDLEQFAAESMRLGSLPYAIDRRFIGKMRARLGRLLDESERAQARQMLKEKLRDRAPT